MALAIAMRSLMRRLFGLGLLFFGGALYLLWAFLYLLTDSREMR